MRVHVVDLWGRDMSVAEREAHRTRSLCAIGARCGHVMSIVCHAVAKDLGVDACASGNCALVFLENHHRRALPHHESVTVAVEGPG